MNPIPQGRLAKAVVFVDDVGLGHGVYPEQSAPAHGKPRGKDATKSHHCRGRSCYDGVQGCVAGPIPPLGPTYRMKTILDDGLVGLLELYFEGGDL
ncbi:MAG: hypothetical protein R3268_04375 [Acidiferrobacterales bacterium]|nr:hypothetical protein [Acidiferrobacterales bacterium]